MTWLHHRRKRKRFLGRLLKKAGRLPFLHVYDPDRRHRMVGWWPWNARRTWTGRDSHAVPLTDADLELSPRKAADRVLERRRPA